MINFDELVNEKQRTVSPKIFRDREIYEAEQERIFGHCWLFLGHESQIPNPLDFTTTYMGEEPIIVWRGRDNTIRAFINSCRHRGMRVCRLEEGNARTFTCGYHGWTYDVRGRLIGRPYQNKYDGAEFNPDHWGLLEVARVESYAGLIFGCFDRQACTLEEYLGEVKWYLDTQVKRTPRGLTVFPGIQKWTVQANWKLGAEQFSGDNYHALITHKSVVPLGFLGKAEEFANKVEPFVRDFQTRTAEGHGWLNLTDVTPPGAPKAFTEYENQVKEDSAAWLSPNQSYLTDSGVVATIFPNFSILKFLGSFALRVWQPKGPDQLELWLYVVTDSEAPEWRAEIAREMQIRCFSTSGAFDVDDSEMWQACQESMGGFYRRKFPLNYSLSAGLSRPDPERPGAIDVSPSEDSIFGFYSRWRRTMSNGNGGDKK